MTPDAIANLALTAVSAVAACIAAYFGWKAPSKKDLQRVEKNTAATSEHIARVHQIQDEQYNAELIRESAKRISILVNGHSKGIDPMTLYLTTKHPDVTLVEVQLTNDIGSSHGEAKCERQATNNFIAVISGERLSEWFNSATNMNRNARRVLILRTRLSYGKCPANRDIPVFLSRDGHGNYLLEGNC